MELKQRVLTSRPELVGQPERAQTHTLEAIAASIFLMIVMTTLVQSVTVTPGVVSMTSEELESDNRQVADDVLDVAVERGILTPAIRYYDTSNNEFHGAGDTAQYESQPPTEFGALLQDTLGTRGVSYNVEIVYLNSDGETTSSTYFVYQGEPTSNAATAERTVLLFDAMEITAPGNGNTLKEDSGFYAPDSQPGTDVYNIVTVRITVWRL